MDVSVIIVNYNTKELIADCIRSIFEKTTEIDYEVIVVDNASNDGSQQMITNNFPNVKLIELYENIGFGRANNEGVKIANGKNIFFLNPDTKLINNAVKILSDFLDNNPKVGACGGNLYNENMKPTHSFRRIFPSIGSEINDLLARTPEKIFYGKNREFNYSDKMISVAYITGADLMIKKSIIEQIGCFSPDFFMYFEETDLCFRIKKNGFDIKSMPNAKIQHLEGKSLGNMKINQRRISFSESSRKVFYLKNYSKIYCKIANTIYFININTRIQLKKTLKMQSNNYWEIILKEYNSTK